MKLWTIASGCLALLLIVAVFALAYWSGFHGGPISVYLALLANTGFTIRLPLAADALGLLIAMPIAIGALTSAQRNRHDFLNYLILFAPALGFASTLFELSTVYRAAFATHTTSLFVMGPSIALSLLPLTAGLVVGTLAGLPHFIRQRSTSEKAQS